MTTDHTVLSLAIFGTGINQSTRKGRGIHPVAWIRSCLPLLLLAPLLFALPSYADTQTRTSAFDYDPVTGLLTKEIIEPDDPNLCLVTTYLYDSFGNKTSATTRNCNGSAGSFPASNTEAAAPAATITVNGASVANPAIITARTSTTTYDSKGQFTISSSNALGQTETKTWNSDFGTLKTLTGPNSLTTNWTYDTFGRKINEARADTTSTQTSYALCSVSACNATLSQFKITTSQAGSAPSTTEYDMLGRAIQSSTQDKDGAYVQSNLTIYDHLGRVSQVAQPARTGDTLTYTSTTYDKLNRSLTVTAPDGTTSTMTYAGLTTTATNAKSQTKVEVRNTQGQLISATDTYSKTLTYQYDAYGNLIKTTDALSNSTIVVYDKRGRKTAMSDPDQGNWSYQYDVLGQLTKQVDAKNQTVSFTYDKLGRMLTRNEPDLKTTWAYDTCDATLNAAGKCTGKPVKESTDNGYIRTYLYDTLGRPTAELDNVDTGYGVTKTYDGYGRVDTLVYPSGFSTRNVYSTNGYLIQVQNSSSNAAYWSANTTDAAGRITKETYGNNISTTRAYDKLGRITQINAGTTASTTSVSNQSFVYDSLGNLTQRYDGATGLNEGFGYDNLNRLTSTSAQAGSGPLTQVTLTYNEIGNILTKSDVGTYTYASLNANGQSRPHAVSKIMMNDGVTQYAAYSYDANGNQITGAGRSIIWNSWNMPTTIIGATQGKSTPNGVAASTFNFVYNASHERVKETLPDGTVVYNVSPRVDTGIHVEKRVKSVNGVTTTTYVNSLYAGGMPFGTYTSTTTNGVTTNKTRYFHGDHLGSIVAITDETGAVTERRSYDAWGKHRNTNGTSMTNAFVTPEERHGFAGHEELDDVGLVHMNGRLYDPTTGRFLSADPSIQYASDMQNYNRYSYINNNPLRSVDMSGFGWFDFVGDIFGAVGDIIGGAVNGFVQLAGAVLKNDLVRTAIAIGIAVYAPGLIGSTNLFGGALYDYASVIAGGLSGLVAGRGDLGAALQGAVTAGVFGQIGDWSQAGSWGWQAASAAHAAGGCITSMVGGGECGSGALSAGFARAVGESGIAGDWGKYANVARNAIIGGTASVLGGGKFENGAMTAAFAYLYSEAGKVLNQRSAARAASSEARPDLEAIAQNPVVAKGIDDAWAVSNPDGPPNSRLEHGFWILSTNNSISIQQFPMSGSTGTQMIPGPTPSTGVIDRILNFFNGSSDTVTIAFFHTHPNPASEGFITGPSPADINFAQSRNLPGIIKSSDGMYYFGPQMKKP